MNTVTAATREKAPGITAVEFADLFPLPFEDFSGPIILIDGVGFSLIKHYGNDYASLYKIGIPSEELRKSTPLKGLYVSISYGKQTPEGITLSPREQSLWDPIDLDYRNELYYNVDTHSFYHNGQEIESREILSTLKETHEKPTKMVQGLSLRCRLWFWRKLLVSLAKYLDSVLIKTLWIISGEMVKEDIWRRIIRIYSNRAQEETLSPEKNFTEAKKVNFFGYEAKRWSVVFYCILHLASFSLFFFFLKKVEHPFLSSIFKNSFLLLCYVVVSFSITESLIPGWLKSTINQLTPKLFNSIASKRLKV